MGRLNNQKFTQIPLGKLKDRLKQLCDFHGIRYQETEESYTAKASYLDGDSLPMVKSQRGGKHQVRVLSMDCIGRTVG